MHLVNLEDFRYGGTNITSLRLVDPTKPEVIKFVEDWKYREVMYYGKTIDPEIAQITVSSIIRFDNHYFAYTNYFFLCKDDIY